MSLFLQKKRKIDKDNNIEVIVLSDDEEQSINNDEKHSNNEINNGKDFNFTDTTTESTFEIFGIVDKDKIKNNEKKRLLFNKINKYKKLYNIMKKLNLYCISREFIKMISSDLNYVLYNIYKGNKKKINSIKHNILEFKNFASKYIHMYHLCAEVNPNYTKNNKSYNSFYKFIDKNHVGELFNVSHLGFCNENELKYYLLFNIINTCDINIIEKETIINKLNDIWKKKNFYYNLNYIIEQYNKFNN